MTHISKIRAQGVKKLSIAHTIGASSFGWLLFRAGNAIAQTTSIGEIQNAANRSGEKSMSMLEMVYGGIVHNPLAGGAGGAGGGMIADVFLALNSCILAVGIVWAFYIFTSSMIGTGQDGEFLGQKKSSAWFVIRMFTGFCSLVPIFGGYCGAQVVILWGTMMGVGIANFSQDAAIAVMKTGGSMVATPVSPSASSLAKYLFEANLCAESANAAIANMPAEAGVAVDASESFNVLTSTGKVVLMNRNGLSCGGAELNLVAPSSAPAGTTYDSIASYTPDPTILYSAMYSAHQTALTTVQTTLNAEAKKYVAAINSETTPPDSVAAISRAARAYEYQINQAIAGSQGNINALADKIETNLKRDGWVMFGAWYQTFAQANTQASNLVSSTAAVVQGTDPVNFPYPQVYRKVMATYAQQSAQAASTSVADPSQPRPDPVASLQTGSVDAKSFFSKIFSGQEWVKMAINQNTGNGNGGATNPLIGMKNFGDHILDAGWTSLVTYVGFKGALGAMESPAGVITTHVADVATGGFVGAAKGALKGVLEALTPFIIIMLVTLFFFGLMLAVYVPMIPFINWYGGVITWYAVVGQGMIASPLWGMTHLDGDGEGMGQRSTHGYIFLLNTIFRPAMMQLGFILGGAGVVVLGTLLNTMFGVAMANAQYDSVTGILMVIGFIGLYVSLCLTLNHGSFSLIHVVPDQVLNWLGGQMAERLGSDTDERTKGTFTGGVHQGRGAGQTSMGSQRAGAGKAPSGPGSFERDRPGD